ncbi:TetR/AcrR family transcriptional regulator [Xylanimonas protaetiae]|uniref:TetR/AcrR family transcriptional regulator n=2 Tax=Xylanimonas protaetiae TaxID=2509457 RepID=A0A4P6F8M9_9MICO|nr:TetR/AcrR family transcriptional regulator [Xylanimonas protaetiae]
MPLVAAQGADVTTRELAAAAGVAEGTLFRVFPDKNTLVGEVAITALLRASEPATTRSDLAGIDRSLPLVERVAAIIDRGQGRMEQSARWIAVLRSLHGRVDAGSRSPADEERIRELRTRLITQHELHRAVIAEGLTAALAPDLDRLRVPLDVAATLIEAAVAHRRPDPNRLTAPLPAAVLADALVHGIVGTPSPAPESKDS